MSAPGPTPPRLLRLDEVRFGDGDVVVRPRNLPSLLVAVVFLAMAGLIGWKHATDEVPLGVAGTFGGLFALCGVWGLRVWLATWRRDAWLLAVGRDGVLVRFRSYLHRRFPAADPQAIELPYARVASVRVTRRRVDRPGAKNTEVRSYRYLDLRLRDTDVEPLRHALARESTLRHRGIRHEHQPVSLAPGGVVRVEMAYNGATTRPRLAEVVRLLAGRVPVEDEAVERIQVPGSLGMPLDESGKKGTE